MLSTLQKLVPAVSLEAMRAKVIATIERHGVPVTSWHSGGVFRSLVEIEASALSDLTTMLSEIVRGGFLMTAKGAWLDLVAASQYDETRVPAVVARGDVVLSDVGGGGPYIIRPGDLWFSSTGGLRFSNLTGGVLEKNGRLVLSVEAESPGASYNVAPLSITVLSTPLPGVRVNNPTEAGRSWLTRQGADKEGDDEFRGRCRAKWATLGLGATAKAYEYWALSASPEVRRVRVWSPPETGVVEVALAGASGPVGDECVAEVQRNLLKRRPITVQVRSASTTGTRITITATLFARPSDEGKVRADAHTGLDMLVRSIPIGGILYRAAVIETLMRVPYVANVTLALPASDIELGTTAVLVADYALTIRAIDRGAA